MQCNPVDQSIAAGNDTPQVVYPTNPIEASWDRDLALRFYEQKLGVVFANYPADLVQLYNAYLDAAAQDCVSQGAVLDQTPQTASFIADYAIFFEYPRQDTVPESFMHQMRLRFFTDGIKVDQRYAPQTAVTARYGGDDRDQWNLS